MYIRKHKPQNVHNLSATDLNGMTWNQTVISKPELKMVVIVLITITIILSFKMVTEK